MKRSLAGFVAPFLAIVGCGQTPEVADAATRPAQLSYEIRITSGDPPTVQQAPVLAPFTVESWACTSRPGLHPTIPTFEVVCARGDDVRVTLHTLCEREVNSSSASLEWTGREPDSFFVSGWCYRR